MKFYHNEKIIIISGFYKGRTGRIKEYKEEKTGILYMIPLNVDDKTIEVWCKEIEIRQKTWYGFKNN
jgi:transcription antitermination factor NusG